MLSILRAVMERTLPIANFPNEKLGDVLEQRARNYLFKGEDVPDELLDELLGGRPTLYKMQDWRVYNDRKMELRKNLRNKFINPSANPKYAK
jgi:hypothetical protein